MKPPAILNAVADSMDFSEVLEGYKSAECGDPEPGPNRGRAYRQDRFEVATDSAERAVA